MEESCPSSNENSIDKLPDAVLVSIVTFLPFKEAARTSVLAKRWRFFWVFNRVLDFDGSKTVHHLRDRRDELQIERVSFVNWVNRVLGLHSSSETIEELRVSFDLNMDNVEDINSWIEFAFRKGVKKLDLNFAETDRIRGQEGPQYCFPNIYHLSLSQPTWESLVSLRLTQVCVVSDFLTSFISNCLFLEELHVENAIGFYDFRTSPKAVRLKRLVIITSEDFTRLEVCSPSLVSCTCVNRCEDFAKLDIGLKDVSALANLSLGQMYLSDLSDSLWNMSKSFSSLETLSFQPIAFTGLDRHRQYPTLPGLKKLVLNVDRHHDGNLLFFTPLLDAAPSLREIVMKLEFSPFLVRRQGRRPEKGEEHRCLQVFEIEGYASVEACPEVIIYVVENASSFQRLIINGKVVTRDVLDLLKSKLDSETCVKDVTAIIFPDNATNKRGLRSMNNFSYWGASRGSSSVWRY